jgi:hypothetical protein
LESNRRDREKQFSELEAFANLGETVDDWMQFRKAYPDFFPRTPWKSELPGFRSCTDWVYTSAVKWDRMMHGKPAELRKLMPTPLLWYRERLRAVWARNDPDGIDLMILCGFEREGLAKGWSRGCPRSGILISVPTALDPLTVDLEEYPSYGGLPAGEHIVNVNTNKISWQSGCRFRELVSKLMQEQRWRAMVCPECPKFFVADKFAQKYCSPRCSAEYKIKYARDRWNLKGNAERKARRRLNWPVRAICH